MDQPVGGVKVETGKVAESGTVPNVKVSTGTRWGTRISAAAEPTPPHWHQKKMERKRIRLKVKGH